MNTIVKEVVVSPDHRVTVEVDVPADFPVGEAVLTLTLEPKTAHAGSGNTARTMFGQGRGKVWTAEDFDAPLEDFAEYM